MTALSILDLAIVSDGKTSGDALADVTKLAQHADELGFTRFWVAEHHNMPTVASTSPGVLVSHIASATESIRVGSGGVMLPNHAPLGIAEQFALLEAVHPNRIDLGIGRAPGTDQATAAAFNRDIHARAESFPNDLIDVMGLLGDPRREDGMWDRFRATPQATSYPKIMLLGSSDFSAQLAAMLGLPFAYAHHFDTGYSELASSIYLERFQPSPVLDEPHLILGVGVLAADTDQEAEELALPGQLLRLGIRSGRFLPLLPPEEAAKHPEADRARAMPTEQISGSAARVAEELGDLVARTGAHEVMLTAATFDVADKIRSLELVAKEMR